MTTSFLRFRMRVLSNKGHGSSCFSSFAPVGSFYLLVSSLLPSSPRHFPSPPAPPFQSHTHTHTHTRLAPKPFLPLLYDPVLCFFPLLGRLLSRRDFDTHYIAAWRARSDFRRSFSVPVLVLDSGVHEQIHSFPPNLSVWAPFKLPAPQSHPCLSAHVGLETFPGFLFFLYFLFMNKPKRKRTIDAAQERFFPGEKGWGWGDVLISVGSEREQRGPDEPSLTSLKDETSQVAWTDLWRSKVQAQAWPTLPLSKATPRLSATRPAPEVNRSSPPRRKLRTPQGYTIYLVFSQERAKKL